MNKATSILVAYFTLFMVCWVYIYSISEIPFVFAIRVTVVYSVACLFGLNIIFLRLGCVCAFKGFLNTNITIHKRSFMAFNQIYLVCR